MNNQSQLIIIIFLSFITISILSIIIFILYHTKIKKVKMNVKPITSKKMKLIDIIILNYPGSNSLEIYPVLQDETNKIYLQFLHYSYGNYESKIKKEIPLQIKMITDNKNEVSQNQIGLVCINEEIGTIEVNENKVIIDNIIYHYEGNILNYNNFETEKTVIYNLYKNNFLEIINNATLYEGIVDFDDLREE
jgi:hypothetical protein